MDKTSIKAVKQMNFPWETRDPFLFCAHHADAYPNGNENLGPATSLEGRNIGQDFEIRDGFRMYHGHTVPGFPSHPHRGFETVTIAKEGLVDHADSLGAAGRFGNGDVQWMTAGKGVQHSEMFPLLDSENANPLEIFQIWLNLPKKNKFVDPHFAMLWEDMIPKLTFTDDNQKNTEVDLIAGKLGDENAPSPAPDSWAADDQNQVNILTIKMSPGAEWTIPAIDQDYTRTLYFYKGSTITVDGQEVNEYHSIELRSDMASELSNGSEDAYLLMLQGKPIGEPVAQYGPFVMNTQNEIMEAMRDYQQTEFGGWPWPRTDQTHDRARGRFAKHADGTEEIKS